MMYAILNARRSRRELLNKMIKLTLKEMRHRKGYTQQEVADHFDVHKNTIINWERNAEQNTLQMNKLKPLLEFYGYEISDLQL